MDISNWVRKAQAGDTDAFERLVRCYQTAVYNLAYRMLGDRMEAEDAAQETFIRAYQGLEGFDMARPFKTWLLSIAAHHCIDRLRRRRPTVSLDEVQLSAASADPESAILRREVREQVQRLLDRLSPADRAVVVLYYWYDGSLAEIAEMLGTSASAIKSRLYRARRQMAEALQEEEDGLSTGTRADDVRVG